MNEDGLFALENMEEVLATLVALSIEYPVVTGLVVLFLLISAAEQIEFGYSYVRDRLSEGRRGIVVLSLVSAALLVISATTVSVLRNAAIGQPEVQGPAPGSTQFFHRVTFSWSPPTGTAVRGQHYELEVTDGERSTRFLAPQPSYQVALLAEGYREGRFQWRVRAVEPQTSRWTRWVGFDYYQDHLTRIRETREIRIGVLADEAHPILYLDLSPGSESGLGGIDVEVARAIVAQMADRGVVPADTRIRWVRGAWLEGLVSDLKAKATDLVVANTGIVASRERTHGIRFSDPYMSIRLALLWTDRGFDEDFVPLTPHSFTDRRVVAWEGSIAERFVSAFGGEPLTHDSTIDNYTFTQLLRGDADAVLEGEYISLCHVTDPANAAYELRREVLTDAPDGIDTPYPSPIGAFTDHSVSGRALLDHVNAALAEPTVRERITRAIDEAATHCPHAVEVRAAGS